MTNNLPDSYPFLEPCPGCFENALQALSERGGSPLFFSNGDFTLERLLTALSKIVTGGELVLCIYRLEKRTVERVQELLEMGGFTYATLFCTMDTSGITLPQDSKLRVIECGMNAFIVQAFNTGRSITLSGLFMQGLCSHGLEMFVVHNDPAEQLLVRKTLFTRFKKQLAYVNR